MLPWSRTEAIDACVEAFTQVPASIHLGPQRVLDRFAKARVSRIGSIASLHLVRRPLTAFEQAVKRAFDIVAGCMLADACCRRCSWRSRSRSSSTAPARSCSCRTATASIRRHFRILKFRSMSVIEDGKCRAWRDP